MKVLIAGFGSIGRRHFRNLKALGVSDFIFFRSKRSTLPDDEIAAYPVETSLDAAFRHEPDIVVVSNPTSLHLQVATPAAQQGCHLFLEKPISHNLEGIDRLQEAVRRSGIKVLIGFQFRFHPQLVQIKELLNRQVIGQIVSVRAEWGEFLPDWHPWEDYRESYSARKDLGGGVVLTLCHPLDYLHWLIGPVDALWAITSKVPVLEIEVDAVAEIGLKFANGALGSLHLDYVQKPAAHRLQIIGEGGKITWDYWQGSLRVVKDTADPPLSYPLPDGFQRNWMFLEQMSHLLDLVKNDVPVRCTLSDGIVTQKLVQAVYTSAGEERIYRLVK